MLVYIGQLLFKIGQLLFNLFTTFRPDPNFRVCTVIMYYIYSTFCCNIWKTSQYNPMDTPPHVDFQIVMQNACNAVQYLQSRQDRDAWGKYGIRKKSDSKSGEIDNRKCQTWRPHGTNTRAISLLRLRYVVRVFKIRWLMWYIMVYCSTIYCDLWGSLLIKWRR
jgi:hypothetical protein